MVRTLLAWGVVSVGVLQIYEPVMHGLHFPEWSLTLVVVGVIVGFPVAAVLSWVFDIGPGGVERTPPSPHRGGVVGGPTMFPAGRPTLDRYPAPDRAPRRPRVLCRRVRGDVQPAHAEFRSTFVAGRSPDCEVRAAEDFVSRQHLKVAFDGRRWLLKDLGSGSGTFVDGMRIDELPLERRTEVALGEAGPCLSLELVTEPDVAPGAGPGGEHGFRSESQIIRRYLDAGPDAPAGRETLLFRRAFQMVQERTSRRYKVAMAVALVLLLALAGVLIVQVVRPGPTGSPPGPSATP